ncbi:MAG: hypothetical protein OXU23_04995 [Candidatus Poribacteria bacterium]|nr:hypothetical protein [Candidatus Poribacteria bacterium]
MATSKGLWLYDVKILEKVKTLQNHKGEVNALAFSPNSQLLVSVGADKTSVVYNIANGMLHKRNTFPIESLLAITFVSLEILRGANEAGNILEWKSRSGEVISNNNLAPLNKIQHSNSLGKRIIKMHSRTAAAFSVDGEILARSGMFAEAGEGLSGIEEVYVRVFMCGTTKKNILHFSMLEEPKYPITAMAFLTKTNTCIAVGKDSGEIVFLDSEIKKVLKPRLAHKDVNALAFSPDGTLASGSKDGTVLIWENPMSK